MIQDAVPKSLRCSISGPLNPELSIHGGVESNSGIVDGRRWKSLSEVVIPVRCPIPKMPQISHEILHYPLDYYYVHSMVLGNVRKEIE